MRRDRREEKGDEPKGSSFCQTVLLCQNRPSEWRQAPGPRPSPSPAFIPLLVIYIFIYLLLLVYLFACLFIYLFSELVLVNPAAAYRDTDGAEAHSDWLVRLHLCCLSNASYFSYAIRRGASSVCQTQVSVACVPRHKHTHTHSENTEPQPGVQLNTSFPQPVIWVWGWTVHC